MTWRIVTIAVYAVVGVCIAGTEWLARHDGHRAVGSRIPTASTLLRWSMRRRSTQIGLLLAWWWLGWHFITAS